MIRLFKMGLDILISSICPIIGWYALGFLVDADIINVFSLVYPLQFIWAILAVIFSDSVNIYSYKNNIENKDNVIVTAIIVVALIGGIIFGSVILNIDTYIDMMKMEPYKYRIFCIYAIIQLYLQLIVKCIVTRLQYMENNKEANNISLAFNVVNLVAIVCVSVITKSSIAIVGIVSIVNLTCIGIIIRKQRFKFKVDMTFYKGFKYSILRLISNGAMFLIYSKGISSINGYGEMYTLGLNISSLTTDTQWDCAGVYEEAANIDLSKNSFNIKKSTRNAYKLTFILITTIFVMFGIVTIKYSVNLYAIRLIMLEIVGLLIYTRYSITNAWLKINDNLGILVIHKMISYTIRIAISLLSNSKYRLPIAMLCEIVYGAVICEVLYRVRVRKKTQVS